MNIFLVSCYYVYCLFLKINIMYYVIKFMRNEVEKFLLYLKYIYVDILISMLIVIIL